MTADNGGTINFGAGGVTLIAASTVDTTAAGEFADGQNITFGDQVVGGFDLGLTAGGVGTINFNGADDAITLNNLTLTSAASSTIAGNLAVNDLITTANVGPVTMTGATNTFDAEVDFINTGSTTFGDGGGSQFTFNDGLLFSTNTASVLNAATVRSSGDQIDFGTGGVTVDAASSINTTVGVARPAPM